MANGLTSRLLFHLARIEHHLVRVNIDSVQFMGIDKEGFQGQPFDAKILSTIASFKTFFPHAIVAVDGGVNLDTAPEIIAVGVDRLIIGSALSNSDISTAETIDEFDALFQES